MKTSITTKTLTFLVVLGTMALLAPTNALAHCDGLDGPVVTTARKALETGNVNLVLIWVKKDDALAIEKSFKQALAVRKLNAEAREMAETYFYETLVRIHRVGEGAPFTGLKPAGRDLGPAIPAADRALEDGSVEPVVKLLTDLVQDGVRDRFKAAVAKKKFEKDDVQAGREYVEAYVQFIHYVEGVYQAAESPAHGHYDESDASATHHEERLSP